MLSQEGESLVNQGCLESARYLLRMTASRHLTWGIHIFLGSIAFCYCGPISLRFVNINGEAKSR